MGLRIPRDLSDALWPHQRKAIKEMRRYLAEFNENEPRSSLVDMPTGSGKTAVIATLARCMKDEGPVIVVTPRVALRDQLAHDIDTRFFEHARFDYTKLGRKVDTIVDGNKGLNDLNKLVVVTTIQMLDSIKLRDKTLYKDLRDSAVLLLFDEGHYEPAVTWSETVRSFSCPRIIFTATPYRDDFKLFDIDTEHVYRYSYKKACQDGYVREVRIFRYDPILSPGDFVTEVTDKYDSLFNNPLEQDPNRPRVIIRCDKSEEIRQIAQALRNKGRSAVSIHENFRDDPSTNEFMKVPNPDSTDATFWVHQFKLMEGIDDPKFKLLALYSGLRSMRAFVQQVGRVIRNPRCIKGEPAFVLDHSKRWEQSRMWKEFLKYDEHIEKEGTYALTPSTELLLEELRRAVPGLLYIRGRIRAPATVKGLDLDELQLPLSANIYYKPSDFSLEDTQQKIVQQCEKDDLFYHAPLIKRHTAAVFYVRVSTSPILIKGVFLEPVLGVSLIRECGEYVFVFDSGPRNLAVLTNYNPNAKLVGLSKLRKLYIRSKSTRLTQVSTLNTNIGTDQIRSRVMSAVDIGNLAPTFDEHSYVLRTAVGYSIKPPDSARSTGDKIRRYVGIGNSRVSDLGAGYVPFEEWEKWTVEIQRLLDSRRWSLRAFKRWADVADVPGDTTPKNILIDVSEVQNRYQTNRQNNLSADQPMELSNLCADIVNGHFDITANGVQCRVEIEYDSNRAKYILDSPELDRVYYSNDPDNREGVIAYLNRTQSLRVIPNTTGYFYTLGQFSKPYIQLGPNYDDTQTGVLSTLTHIGQLRNFTSEKGRNCRPNGSGWEQGCLFNLIDKYGTGTGLSRYFNDTEVMVCDDPGDECADFILVQQATRSRPRKRVVFIHAKVSSTSHYYAASELSDVCAQVVKNLREV